MAYTEMKVESFDEVIRLYASLAIVKPIEIDMQEFKFKPKTPKRSVDRIIKSLILRFPKIKIPTIVREDGLVLLGIETADNNRIILKDNFHILDLKTILEHDTVYHRGIVFYVTVKETPKETIPDIREAPVSSVDEIDNGKDKPFKRYSVMFSDGNGKPYVNYAHTHIDAMKQFLKDARELLSKYDDDEIIRNKRLIAQDIGVEKVNTLKTSVAFSIVESNVPFIESVIVDFDDAEFFVRADKRVEFEQLVLLLQRNTSRTIRVNESRFQRRGYIELNDGKDCEVKLNVNDFLEYVDLASRSCDRRRGLLYTITFKNIPRV